MPDDAKFGAGARLVHLKAVKVGSLTFAGYSFRAPLPRRRQASGTAEYGRRCRALLRAAIRKSGADLRRCVLLAHDRARHLDRDFPNLLLHIYGHVHTFEVLRRGTTTYVNASALDRLLPVAPKHDRKRLRHVNDGIIRSGPSSAARPRTGRSARTSSPRRPRSRTTLLSRGARIGRSEIGEIQP
jgi:hypothetical protein